MSSVCGGGCVRAGSSAGQCHWLREKLPATKPQLQKVNLISVADLGQPRTRRVVVAAMMAGLAARATAQHVHIAPLFGKLSVEEQEACSRHFLARHGDGDVTATWDGEPPAETTVLVQGRPSESTLHRCKALHTLIIPFAGLPNETKEAVRALRAAQGGAGSEPRPALRVMNLHINAGATAEMAVTLLLAAMKRVVPLNEAMHRGDWSQRFEPTGFGSLVEGCVAVVVGFGAIGTRVATVLLALGAGSVRVVRGSHPPDAPPADVACGAGKVKVYSAHQLRRAMRQATVVVVTCPLTDATRDCIGSAELDALAKGAVLVNVGRGKVVNEEALYQALQSGQLGGAGIDVWYDHRLVVCS